ncbi:uncharacterized protein LOC119678390, partial [Teleopsis dalmanni]|uniref:uncharacterized protein LOC119678390 n=1 Tax=Teleopsis dalmanni TaxID=139649 RepID=UPI0018CE2D90
ITGSEIEKKLYQQIGVPELVQRLLAQRCVCFIGGGDSFLLLNNIKSFDGFEEVGTVKEKLPLTLQNVLSYDEIKLSALLSVSSHSEFINNGNRNNNGRVEIDKSKIVPCGVIIGLIGARFERKNVMEWQDVMITPEQNTFQNGYGLPMNEAPKNGAENYRRLWKEFYDEKDFEYEKAAKITDKQRFHDMEDIAGIFDNLMLKKRYTISFDTLLLDSNSRAAAINKQAYIHVVGIGLGVWKAVDYQNKLFLKTFSQRLKVLMPKLSNVAAVHFSWFHLDEFEDLKNNGFLKSEAHPNGGIKIFLSDRNPAAKLPSEFTNSLLVVSYAWDGNAFPGNEFWIKMLNSTGDASTACSTLITELHNPLINCEMVNGENLHIASEEFGIIHLGEYAKKILEQK